MLISASPFLTWSQIQRCYLAVAISSFKLQASLGEFERPKELLTDHTGGGHRRRRWPHMRSAGFVRLSFPSPSLFPPPPPFVITGH